MSLARIVVISRRVIRQFLRDRRSVVMLFGVPIVIMTLLSLVVELNVSELKVGLYAEGASSIFSSEMVSTLEEELRIEELFDAEEARVAVESGTIDALLVLPADFLEKRAANKTGTIAIHLLGDNPSRTGSVFRELRDSLSGVLDGVPALLPAECSDECSEAVNTKFPVLEQVFVHGNSELRLVDFHASFFATFFVFFFSFVFCSLAFLRERTQGTMERLLVSPVRPTEIFLGYVTGFFAFVTIQSVVVVCFLLYVLKVYVAGSPWLVLLAIVPTVLIAESIGIFVSGFSKREFQVVQFVPIVIFPQVLLSNLFWPVSDFPWWLKPFAYLMPVYYADQAARVVFIEGKGVGAMLPSLGVLLLMCVITMLLTSRAIAKSAEG